MKIVILKPAQAELDDAADYYADRASLRIAQAFLDDFEHARQRLAELPGNRGDHLKTPAHSALATFPIFHHLPIFR